MKINFLALRALIILSLSIVATAVARSITLGPLAHCETNLEKSNTSYACLNKYSKLEKENLLSTEILISGLLTALVTTCLSFVFSFTHLKAVKKYLDQIKFKKPTFVTKDLLVEDLGGEIVLNSESNSDFNEKISAVRAGAKNTKEIFK